MNSCPKNAMILFGGLTVCVPDKDKTINYLRMKTIHLLTVLMMAASSCSIIPAKKIYVTNEGDDAHTGSKSRPLQSIEAAQQAVRNIRMENPGRDVRVMFGNGTWYLTRPITLTAEDGGSGTGSVSWEGAPGGKTLFSGGKVISGFQDAGYGIWWANVDPSIYFEQLYVDGVRATRARIPNVTDSMPFIYLNNSTWVYNPDSTVKNITVSLRDRGLFKKLMPTGEFEAVIFKDWTISRFHVISLNADPAEIYLKPPFALFTGNYISIFAPVANRYNCYLEGDPCFIDQPGEWALDRKAGRLYYRPLPGQVLSETSVIAPFADQLVTLKGERGKPIENFGFRNIRFENCAYRLPEFNHDGIQAAFYFGGYTEPDGKLGLIPPAIQMTWATRCAMTGCTLSHAGGNGIYLREGCRENRLDRVVVEDIGANGVMIGLDIDPLQDSMLLPVNNTVAGCTVHQAGVAFQGSIGIWLGFCAGNEISGCEVYDLPYTGISVGWQWNPLPSSSKNNRLLNNKIHHAMQMMGDGGGIYTLGFQPGSVIAGNDIHDILRSKLNHASANNGIFMDEGSKGYLVENNTIRNTAFTSIRGHRASGVELRGNTFYSGDQPAISCNPPFDKTFYAGKDTTIRWKNPGWPAEWGYPDTVTAFTMHGNRFLRSNPTD